MQNGLSHRKVCLRRRNKTQIESGGLLASAQKQRRKLDFNKDKNDKMIHVRSLDFILITIHKLITPLHVPLRVGLIAEAVFSYRSRASRSPGCCTWAFCPPSRTCPGRRPTCIRWRFLWWAAWLPGRLGTWRARFRRRSRATACRRRSGRSTPSCTRACIWRCASSASRGPASAADPRPSPSPASGTFALSATSCERSSSTSAGTASGYQLTMNERPSWRENYLNNEQNRRENRNKCKWIHFARRTEALD